VPDGGHSRGQLRGRGAHVYHITKTDGLQWRPQAAICQHVVTDCIISQLSLVVKVHGKYAPVTSLISCDQLL